MRSLSGVDEFNSVLRSMRKSGESHHHGGEHKTHTDRSCCPIPQDFAHAIPSVRNLFLPCLCDDLLSALTVLLGVACPCEAFPNMFSVNNSLLCPLIYSISHWNLIIGLSICLPFWIVIFLRAKTFSYLSL